MKTRIKLFTLFLIWSGMIFAQNQLSGVVFIDSDAQNSHRVSIYNQTQKVHTQSDITGHFTILAEVNDSILFTADFLEKRYFKVTQEALNKKDFIIHLNKEELVLKELVIRPKLTGNYLKDMASLPKNDTVEKLYADLGFDIRVLDMKPEEKKERITLPIPLVINVEALYKNLSGYYRKMKNRKKYEVFDEKINSVLTWFGSSYFTEALDIPQNENYAFVTYCFYTHTKEYNQFYKDKRYLEFDTLFRQLAKEYKVTQHEVFN